MSARGSADTYAGPMHVVVIDDEQRMVTLISSYLEDQQISSVACYDGPSGLAAARGFDVDAVVLDLMLPGMSGIEVCTQLRREGNDVPILMLTVRPRGAARAVPRDQASAGARRGPAPGGR